MNKQFILIYGAVDCFAGYGRRAYDIALSLIKSEKYDVRIIPCNWGNTPKGFLKEDNLDHKLILDRLVDEKNKIDKQPDVFMMVTIPPEMQQLGKFNILVTAGIESTITDPSWIIGCNKADLVLVSSKHAKDVFENSKFEERDKQTNQIIKKIELTTSIEVLFEGVSLDTYSKLESIPKEDITEVIDSIDEDFCFLQVGHWMIGDLYQDRKDIGGLIKTFLETFKDKSRPPALVLKVNGGVSSIIDRDNILNKINKIKSTVSGKLPNIYLLHGELLDEEMNMLYNHPKIKAMVSFTKGEGFGRPLLEFSITGKPVIVSGWSGQIDFINKETLLSGSLTPIHRSAVVQNMLIEGSKWFTVDYKVASKVLGDVCKSYKKYLDYGKIQAYKSKTNFSLINMGEKLLEILKREIPEYKELIIPSIKRPII